jgi:hypothetical protein
MSDSFFDLGSSKRVPGGGTPGLPRLKGAGGTSPLDRFAL